MILPTRFPEDPSKKASDPDNAITDSKKKCHQHPKNKRSNNAARHG